MDKLEKTKTMFIHVKDTYNITMFFLLCLIQIQHLLGDIGGTLGLYIGLSVLTIFEFGEFVICVFRIFVRRLTIRMNKNNVHANY